jgi:hypothetical protein
MQFFAALKRFPRALLAGLSTVFSSLVRGPTSSSTAAPDSDEQRIRAEVNRRKQRAREVGIITSAWELNHDLRFYEAWAVNCPQYVHPAVRVTAQTETVNSNERARRIEATIRENIYAFVFRERSFTMPDGEPFSSGNLDVEFQGHRVMTVDCDCEVNEYAGDIWHTRDVSAFIDGPWVPELNSIFADVSKVRAEQERVGQEAAKKEELRKLKKDFGL